MGCEGGAKSRLNMNMGLATKPLSLSLSELGTSQRAANLPVFLSVDAVAKPAALDERNQTWLRRVVQLNVATPVEQEKRAREQLVDRFIHDFTLSRVNADLLSWSLQSDSDHLSCVEMLAASYWVLDPVRRRSFAVWQRRFQGGPSFRSDGVLLLLPLYMLLWGVLQHARSEMERAAYRFHIRSRST